MTGVAVPKIRAAAVARGFDSDDDGTATREIWDNLTPTQQTSVQNLLAVLRSRVATVEGIV